MPSDGCGRNRRPDADAPTVVVYGPPSRDCIVVEELVLGPVIAADGSVRVVDLLQAKLGLERLTECRGGDARP